MRKNGVAFSSKRISFVRGGGAEGACMNFRQRIFQRRNEKLDRVKTNDKQADLIFENPSPFCYCSPPPSPSYFPSVDHPAETPNCPDGLEKRSVGIFLLGPPTDRANWGEGEGEGRRKKGTIGGNNTVCKVIRERGRKKKKRERKKLGGRGGEIVDFERLNEKVERCRTRGGEGGVAASSHTVTCRNNRTA